MLGGITPVLYMALITLWIISIPSSSNASIIAVVIISLPAFPFSRPSTAFSVSYIIASCSSSSSSSSSCISGKSHLSSLCSSHIIFPFAFNFILTKEHFRIFACYTVTSFLFWIPDQLFSLLSYA